MRKYILSFTSVVLFILYVVIWRQEPAVRVAAPRSALSSGVQAAGTSSPANAPGAGSTAHGTASSVASQVAEPSGLYKDGVYAGTNEDAFYGYVQVQAVVSGGKLTDVQFLSYPNDRHESRSISNRSLPYLTQEAISSQSANVDIVSGATETSQAFRQSLATALSQAQS